MAVDRGYATIARESASVRRAFVADHSCNARKCRETNNNQGRVSNVIATPKSRPSCIVALRDTMCNQSPLISLFLANLFDAFSKLCFDFANVNVPIDDLSLFVD